MDSGTYIGAGKARDISLMVQSADVDLLIVDDELTGAQVRNLEQIVGCRVVDRTALILDIFAMRASSREGKLQVELAQMKYQLPRLSGLGVVMSRLGGGIGTRGRAKPSWKWIAAASAAASRRSPANWTR